LGGKKKKDFGVLPYKLSRLFQTQHSFSVTIFTLGFRLFFILLQINLTCFAFGLLVSQYNIQPMSVFPLDLALPAIINNKTGDAGVGFHIFVLVVGG
jgi:hypothetical protein